MSNDYERTRITEQIKRLQRKLASTEYDKTRAERDEQIQIERVRSEFKTRISRLESSRTNIEQEIKSKETELEKLDLLLRGSESSSLTPAQQAKQKRLRGHLR